MTFRFTRTHQVVEAPARASVMMDTCVIRQAEANGKPGGPSF